MPNTFARSTGRVSIDASVHDLYKQLTTGKSAEDSPFLTMKDLFMLAACTGFQEGRRKSLEKGRREQIFLYSVFSDSVDAPILKAIAIAATGNLEILADGDQIVNIAEEYANAGIVTVRAIVEQNTGLPLWNLVEQIRAFSESDV